MSSDNSSKQFHLEMVTRSMERMAKNSAMFKAWSITAFSIVSAVAIDKDRYELFIVNLIVVIGFYVADSYYLWLEKVFVKLYEEVARGDSTDYIMNIEKHKKSCTLRSAFFSVAQVFYLVLTIIIGVVTYVQFYII